jgi:translation initiation factor 1 (eIF-1/SUI1)
MTDKLKVIFAEGCFDDFDGTQEELADFIAEIQNMANNGTLMDGAVELKEDESEALQNLLKSREIRQ